jgi:hypothetical protein
MGPEKSIRVKPSCIGGVFLVGAIRIAPCGICDSFGADQDTFGLVQFVLNQDNIVEGNSRVRIMGQSYAFADTVVVWIGPGRLEDYVVLGFNRTRVVP